MVLSRDKPDGLESKSCSTKRRKKERHIEEIISSGESEPCSDVSFGWLPIIPSLIQNMASKSDNESSDTESSTESSEPECNENLQEGNELETEDSDVDSTSSEEEILETDGKRGDISIKNTEVTEDIFSQNDDVVEPNDNEQQDYLKVPENYVPLHSKGGLMLEEISEDDEVWMVQCPVFLNPEDLKGKKLQFGGTSEFAVKQKNGEEQWYETTSYTDMNRPLSCLLPTGNSRELVAKVLKSTGLIVIKEKISIPDVENDPIPKQRSFNIPEDLKVRHPLFGSGYEEELDARRNLKRKRTDDKIDSPSPNKRQKTKQTESEGYSTENSITPEKKKKKKKSKNIDPEKESASCEENIPKKKKKKSKDKTSESENVTSEESSSKKKKKKSKSRDIETESIHIDDTIVKNKIETEEEFECEDITSKKKKKTSKNKDTESENVIGEEIPSKKKKKKSKNKDFDSENVDIDASIVKKEIVEGDDEVEEEETVLKKKKKKHKRKSREESEMCLD